MRDRLEDLGDHTDVVLLTFTGEREARDYADAHDLGFGIVRDPDREAYCAFGLGQGRWTRVWGVRAARRYSQILRRDGVSGLRRPTEDTRQLGGDFVVDPDGTLVYGFWGAGPDDRPSVDELVAAITSH